MKNPVGWFEIYVDDMARARGFYEQVFGVQLTRLDGIDLEMWAFPMAQDAYGASGALVKMPGLPAGARGTLVYFSCEDCAAEVEKAAAAGGRIQQQKMSIGQHGHIAIVADTEGNLIGLHSMR